MGLKKLYLILYICMMYGPTALKSEIKLLLLLLFEILLVLALNYTLKQLEEADNPEIATPMSRVLATARD